MIHRLWTHDAPLAQGSNEEDIPKLELFLLKDADPKGLVIICPGGAYHRRAPHEAYPVAEWLNAIGVSAAVLHYRVYPYAYPSAWLDGKRAIRYAREHAREWNIDPEHIGMLGFSAGGHLASMVGTQFDAGDPSAEDPVERHSSRPDALILCYPVISFREPYTHAGSREVQLGPEPEDHLIQLLSNEQQVNENTPPAFLWHTAEDVAVPPENSMLFAMELARHRIPYELHVFEEGRHGIGLADEVPDTARWMELCERWLARRGFLP
ncbi:alpha/beta hydrolase [Paenibacillus soyae]|uniref:Alpha/beta hydrolase n=1 Tax=Paenibacillus soyae TaxID=2969249 RepID=A0A9X2MWA6_9BACL|nr:alpha/beta hydrolase [Paenibacillus soyae]MCR2807497.1 alpha/beta hydrolase [Paenibacillus soyae]